MSRLAISPRRRVKACRSYFHRDVICGKSLTQRPYAKRARLGVVYYRCINPATEEVICSVVAGEHNRLFSADGVRVVPLLVPRCELEGSALCLGPWPAA